MDIAGEKNESQLIVNELEIDSIFQEKPTFFFMNLKLGSFANKKQSP